MTSRLRNSLRYQAARAGWSREYMDMAEATGRSVGNYFKEKIKRGKRKSFPQQKIKMGGPPTTKSNPIKRLTNKSATKITGKRKLKHDKTVKVSKKFRAGVKQVLAGSQAQGTYKTFKIGMVGTLLTASTSSMAGDDLGVTGTQIQTPGQDQPAGSRTLFNQLVDYKAGGTSAVVPGTGLNFFTIGKILDAASVLFNRKTPTVNPYVGTNNLSTAFNPSTGAVSVNPAGLKIKVLNSRVDFRMKNLSNRTITMEIWELTPTMKFQNDNPILSLINHSVGFLDLAVLDSQVKMYNTGTLMDTGRFMTDGYLDPFAIMKKCGYHWNYVKRTMIMAPEETCVHSIKGPSGLLDFNKTYTTVGTTSVPTINNLFMKGWGVSVVMSVVGDQVLQGLNPAGTLGAKVHYYKAATPGALGAPVAVEVEETYKIAVPEIAGFMDTVSATQTLNLRKHKLVTFNNIGPNGDSVTGANVQPVISNEENPIAEVTTGQAW